jgi:hypothetical protein
MHEDDNRRLILHQQMRQTASSALLAAGLMLLFAYVTWTLRGVSDSPIYNLAVGAFPWTLLFGGLLMLSSALLCWAKTRNALLLDAVSAGTIGAALILIGIVQIAHDGPRNINAILMLLFGFLFLRSAHASWGAHFELGGDHVFVAARHEAGLEPEEGKSKAEAMQRLLAHKARATESRTPANDAPPPAASWDEPQVEQAEQATEDQSWPRRLETGATQVPPPDDAAPEGFLADLGRDDADADKERK